MNIETDNLNIKNKTFDLIKPNKELTRNSIRYGGCNGVEQLAKITESFTG